MAINFNDFENDNTTFEKKDMTISKNSGELISSRPDVFSDLMKKTVVNPVEVSKKLDKLEKETLHVVHDMYDSNLDFYKHCISETEKTKQVTIEAMANVEIANINSNALVQQSFNELEKVRIDCDTKLQLQQGELKKYEMEMSLKMKILEDGRSSYKEKLEVLKDLLKDQKETKNHYMELMKRDEKLEKFEEISQIIDSIMNKNLELGIKIADLTVVYSLMPEV